MKKNNLYNYVGNDPVKSIYSKMHTYLISKYILKLNEVDNECYIAEKGVNPPKFSPLEEASIIDELSIAGLVVTIKNLKIYINSRNRVPRYNPIKEYFDGLPPWDGIDYVGQLCSYVKTNYPKEFRINIEKWLVRSILCVLEHGIMNKHCIILMNKIQNSGKTTYLRYLCPPALKKYYNEDASLNKDGRIKLTANFIINLDELTIEGGDSLKSIKSFLSKLYINDRKPWGFRQEKIKRIANFIGSTNEDNFLKDKTGNVRWIVFEVLDYIEYDYTKISIDKVWSQAYHLAYHTPNYKYELSKEEIASNERRVQKYIMMSYEEELIDKYFLESDDLDDFMSASDFIIYLQKNNFTITKRLNNNVIGSALSNLGFKRIKPKGQRRYGYLIKRR